MATKKKEEEESYSSYWLDDGGMTDASEVSKLIRFASIRRAIANFVHILTNDPTIDVHFSSGDKSYTDGKMVVISADDSPEKFDMMVGLALHEASHCVLSNFEFLKNIGYSNYAFYGSLHPDLRKMFPVETVDGVLMSDLRECIKLIMNVIEDRRIDSYVYTNAAGYRPYYDAMYKHYFLKPEITKNILRNPEWRVPTVENYINWLLMMISPDFIPDALPGLDVMVQKIDIKNIRRLDAEPGPIIKKDDWKVAEKKINPKGTILNRTYSIYEYDQFSLLWKISNEIMLEILKYVKYHTKGPWVRLLNSNISKADMMHLDDAPPTLPNLDVMPGKFDDAKGKRDIKLVKDVTQGETKKKKMSDKQSDRVRSIESASSTMVENTDPVLGTLPCMTTKKLTKDMLLEEWFPFSDSRMRNTIDGRVPYFSENSHAKEGVLAGIRMGQILTHRLQVRNDPTITHFTRQDHGKIDRRLLAQLGMDITTVFKRTTTEHYRPAILHLSIDASGSMYAHKWKNVITVASALAYTADRIQNLDVVVTLRGVTVGNLPMVAVAYDSRVDTFKKVQTIFPYLSPNGSTPEGLCYVATMDLITECASTHRTFFINFSDGEPGVSLMHGKRRINYTGNVAVQHTKRVVSQIREAGISILSYFITNNTSDRYQPAAKRFNIMYGNDAEYINVQNVTSVLKTLNKLLLTNV